MNLLLSSFLIGFFAAASPGAVQMTVLQSSLLGHKRNSILLAAGVACTNFVLLFLGYFGISQAVKIPWLFYIIGTGGVGYMLLIGISGLWHSFGKESVAGKIIEKQSFIKGVLLCVLSPLTYLYFIGVAASFLSIKNFVIPLVVVNSLLLAVGSFICYVVVAYIGIFIYKTNNKKIITVLHFVASAAIIFFAVRIFFSLWM